MYHLLNLALCVLLLLLDHASAAPTSKQSLVPRSFKIHHHPHAKTVRNAHRAMRKAYGKWGIPLPEGLTVVPAARNKASDPSGQTGEVTNTPTQYDASFVSPIEIGGQTIMMDFDTGSADL